MGFWNELVNANPHRSMKRAKELEAEIIKKIAPLHDPTKHGAEMKNGFPVCSVCRVEIGNVSKAQPFTVVVDSETPLTFSNTNNITVCSGCLEMFDIG